MQSKPVPCKKLRARAGKVVAECDGKPEAGSSQDRKISKWCKIQVITDTICECVKIITGELLAYVLNKQVDISLVIAIHLSDGIAGMEEPVPWLNVIRFIRRIRRFKDNPLIDIVRAIPVMFIAKSAIIAV